MLNYFFSDFSIEIILLFYVTHSNVKSNKYLMNSIQLLETIFYHTMYLIFAFEMDEWVSKNKKQIISSSLNRTFSHLMIVLNWPTLNGIWVKLIIGFKSALRVFSKSVCSQSIDNILKYHWKECQLILCYFHHSQCIRFRSLQFTLRILPYFICIEININKNEMWYSFQFA